MLQVINEVSLTPFYNKYDQEKFKHDNVYSVVQKNRTLELERKFLFKCISCF